MEDWREISKVLVPPPAPHEISSPAAALAFDDVQELLWVGNDRGRINSFHGPQLQRYSSAKAHIDEGPIKQILVHERGIISMSSKSLHLTSRRGPAKWHLEHDKMIDLRCMCATGLPNQILVAGCQPYMLLVDIIEGIVLREIYCGASYTLLKKSRHICAATDNGVIHVLNLSDFTLLKSWKAHAAAVNDMDARNDFLVTCGFSIRQSGVNGVDPFARVYDLKSLETLPPIPFQAGAAYVRLHPNLQTTGFIASQTGQMQVVDLMNPVNVMLRQANVQFMLAMEISSSGNALALTDSNALIYLWGSPNKAHFNNISKETEFADPPPPNIPHVDWKDSPLNAIGMPYYTERLLSAWPSHMIHELGAPPLSMDPTLEVFLQPAEMGHYGPYLNPRRSFRNQVQDTRSAYLPASIAAPKFLSEKAKDFNGDVPQALGESADGIAALTIPGRPQTNEERMLKYSNVEIKYSRFGVDDFDFEYYNKTAFSGLETHIKHSFINALLQLYRFIPLVRNLAIQHAATRCVGPNCLLCEFGFLFDMLERAAGQNCQATNLLRAFGASREAANKNLFVDPSSTNGPSFSTIIQAVNKFFLQQMVQEFQAITGKSDAFDEILATSALEAIRCMYCGSETTKHGNTYAHDLFYPQLDPKHNMRNPIFRFSSILKQTIEREVKTRGWCNKCRRYQQLSIQKSILHLPFVLMLNANLISSSMRILWETPGWLPAEIGIIIQGRSVHCFEGQDLHLHIRNKSANMVIYELVGFVAEVDTSERQQPHLVSMVDVNISTPRAPTGPSAPPDWHLFNDFLVSPVEVQEALQFKSNWKMPSVITYQVKTAHGRIDNSWKASMDTSLLYEHYSYNGIKPALECEVLSQHERPTEGTAIALDTEFVELEKAEIDVKADGSQETIRPAKSGLARVSVLRGDGPKEGTPFIDDYIISTSPIVDYKTQYSGIRPGDLDIQTSSHNLVYLKVAYKKLWLLLNLGCVFVGHGLASDFRKANIHVPKSQTIDTQYLYLSQGKNRRFSLRYLAWAVFREYIQEEPPAEMLLFQSQSGSSATSATNNSSSNNNNTTGLDGHDSIEDARMALRLWRKFQEYEESGILTQIMEDIYKRGTRYGWKPPPRSLGAFGMHEFGLGSSGGGVSTAGGSAVPSGRNTPDMGSITIGGGGGGAGPLGTPGPRTSGVFKFAAGGGGFGGFGSGAAQGNGVGKESPLR